MTDLHDAAPDEPAVAPLAEAHEQDARTQDAADDTKQTAAGGSTGADPEGVDLKGIFRQLTAPMIESLDSRLREQVEAHVDELMTVKIDAAVADRLATVDRAIAHLSHALDELVRRVSLLESHGDDLST